MYGLQPDVAISILRHILTFIGGMVVARGWISADVAAQLTGAVVTIVSLLYAAFFHAASNGSIVTQSTTPNILKPTEVIIAPMPTAV